MVCLAVAWPFEVWVPLPADPLGGIKAFGTNFAIGSVMLALIEGFNMYLTNRVMKIAEMQQEQLFGKSGTSPLLAPHRLVLQLTPPYTNFRENISMFLVESSSV